MTECGFGFGEWEYPVDDRHDFVLLHESGHAREIRGRTHRGAEDVDLAEESLAQIESLRIAGGGAEENDATAWLREFDERGEAIAAGAVDDDVEKPPGGSLQSFRPIRGSVVGSASRTERLGACDFFGRTRGHPDFGTGGTSTEQREERCAAAGAGDEDFFAGLELGAGEQCAPGREAGQRYRGRLLPRKVRRFGCEIRFRNEDSFRKGPGVGHAEDPEIAMRSARVVAPVERRVNDH